MIAKLEKERKEVKENLNSVTASNDLIKNQMKKVRIQLEQG